MSAASPAGMVTRISTSILVRRSARHTPLALLAEQISLAGSSVTTIVARLRIVTGIRKRLGCRTASAHPPGARSSNRPHERAGEKHGGVSVGWDFTNDWYVIDGETRPFGRWEYSTTITNTHQLQLMAMDLTANYTAENDIDFDLALAVDADGNYPGMWGPSGFVPAVFGLMNRVILTSSSFASSTGPPA